MQKLRKIFKTICSDARQAIIGAIVILLVGGTTGIVYFYKTALSFSIQILNSPTPLWTTILFVLLCCVYIHFKLIQKVSTETIQYYEAFGAFWDKKLNPRCLSCKKPLKHSSSDSPSLFFCSDSKNCNSKHILKDDSGIELTKREAIEKLKAIFKGGDNQETNNGLV
jgi:hypothetical protein